MKTARYLSRQGAGLTLSVCFLSLSACGDSSSNKTQDIQDTAGALQTLSEVVNRADTGRTSAAQLVAEHEIDWSNQFFFPLAALEGKTGPQAMFTAYSRLEKLAGSKSVDKQIRQCHEFTFSKAGVIDMTYQHENDAAMRLFNEEKARVTEYKGQRLEHDLSLHYFGLIPQYLKGTEGEDKTALREAFWQWCIELPNKHWAGHYASDPISL